MSSDDDAVGLAELVGAAARRRCRGRAALSRVRCRPEAAVAAVELVDRRAARWSRRSSAERCRHEHQLAVGQLPHQRRRQPGRRAEHERPGRARRRRRVQRRGDRLLVDRRRALARWRIASANRCAAVGRRVDDDRALPVARRSRCRSTPELGPSTAPSLAGFERPQRQPRAADGGDGVAELVGQRLPAGRRRARPTRDACPPTTMTCASERRPPVQSPSPPAAVRSEPASPASCLVCQYRRRPGTRPPVVVRGDRP